MPDITILDQRLTELRNSAGKVEAELADLRAKEHSTRQRLQLDATILCRLKLGHQGKLIAEQLSCSPKYVSRIAMAHGGAHALRMKAMEIIRPTEDEASEDANVHNPSQRQLGPMMQELKALRRDVDVVAGLLAVVHELVAKLQVPAAQPRACQAAAAG